MKRAHFQFALPAALLLAFLAPPSATAAAKGWLYWRGPNDNGTSSEKGLPEKLDAAQPLWVADLAGKSTPVIADGKLYIIGHVGEGPDLQEVIACFEAETGRKLWQHGYNDFLSDIIYTRYATSNPTSTQPRAMSSCKAARAC
jgi:outer membrane protein assembly factor BamB